MTLDGVDISHWQPNPPWDKLVAQGISYCISKATDGLTTDSTYAAHVAGSLGAGLISGAYHYLEPGDGAAQADHFIAVTNSAHGLLAALDCEAPGLTIGIIRDFTDRFKAKVPDHPLFIYTGIAFWHKLGNPPMPGPLWLAYYPKGGYGGDTSNVWKTLVGGARAVVWQYGPGPFKYDGDAFRGTRDELAAYIGGTTGGPQQPEEPVSTFKPAPGRFAVPVGTRIFDAPNGKPISTVQANSAYVDGMLTVLGGVSGWRVCVVNTATAAWIAADTGQDFPPVPPAVDCSASVAAEHERTRAAAIAAVEGIQ